ncbi:MAG: class I SAM-dependent methyltransferase, partial [Oscillospiraceae bacterium]|nr:class I SAM-dependent methyltransferase [Oscillospiraceae bacterium]
MLGSEGFDLWADGYDKSVGLSDEDGTYPFAGYKNILNAIFNRVLGSSAKNVLDIGFGTGTLTSKLYENGAEI